MVGSHFTSLQILVVESSFYTTFEFCKKLLVGSSVFIVGKAMYGRDRCKGGEVG